jgi:hypothetical protein
MNFDRLIQECRHAALAAGLFIALVSPPALDAQGGGTITGTVSTAATGLKPLRVTMDQRVCGNELPDESVVVNGAGRLANAVVTVVGTKSRARESNGGVMNEKCRFAPRVQIVSPKASITTSSKDPILHTTNASMDGGKGLFNVAVPVPGINIVKPVNGAGLVRVVCNTHPWMRGYIVVTEEMAAVSAADGAFTLRDVPAGMYELRVWHETLKAPAQKVTVTTGQTATVNFELK